MLADGGTLAANKPLHESPREGGDPKITKMGEHFVMDLCQAFLNTQKRDSLQFFFIKWVMG